MVAATVDGLSGDSVGPGWRTDPSALTKIQIPIAKSRRVAVVDESNRGSATFRVSAAVSVTKSAT